MKVPLEYNTMFIPRDAKHPNSYYVNPTKEVNAGLWTLFSAATILLFARVYCKVTRRRGLWYDDYVLILAWAILLANDALISVEYATGYVSDVWDDRMHILINVSSCGTLIGQALSKTAFGLTLLRMGNKWQKMVLVFCMITMNGYMFAKCLFQWAKICRKSGYQNWYRLDFCIPWTFSQRFKQGGQSYNIIMDFIFAIIPWVITWKLDLKKKEKIGLCITMSLGMLIAITSAIRTAWDARPIMHVHDPYYHWRDAMSNIWFSAEVAGTIMVQCIPVLRPFLREVHASFTSTRLTDRDKTNTNGYGTWCSYASLVKPRPVIEISAPVQNARLGKGNDNIEMGKVHKHVLSAGSHSDGLTSPKGGLIPLSPPPAYASPNPAINPRPLSSNPFSNPDFYYSGAEEKQNDMGPRSCSPDNDHLHGPGTAL